MKIKKFSAVLLLILMAVFGRLYYINAAEEYKILDPKYNISPNHEFSIRLSQELDESSLKEGTVRIYDRVTLNPVEVVARRDTYDAKVIKVKGKYDFEAGKTYTLEVKDLKSKTGKYFKEPIRMDFVVKNRYSGLPAENGLIIVGDKAYAIDYLKNNIRMVNEIITKTYDIYYTYDVNYEKIYSLFKTGAVYGQNVKRKDGDIMSYIDPDGRTHLYVWKEDRQEYQLAEPKARVEVLERNGVKTVNVLSVSAVPNAKYYKLKNSIDPLVIGVPLPYVGIDSIEEISILSADKSVLAKGVVSVERNSSGEVRLRLSEDQDLGNTPGNINNNGIAVEGDDGYIYYVNNSDKQKLYKESIGGFYNRNILEDKAQYVNKAGDWLYYSNYSDGGLLYKVKKDGTERQKLLDDKAAYITVSGEYVYYSNHSEGGKLYKIKKDGTDAKVWPDNSRHGNPVVVDYGNFSKTTDEVAYINIAGDWIYYSNYSDGHKPYVIHKDGTYRGKLSDKYADSVQVEGDWVYFTSGSGVISKVSKSGMGFVVPIKGTTTEFNKGYHINVHGDWIYYSDAEDKGKLYKINTDGSGNKIKLSDESVGYINIVGDWVYFTTTKNKLFRVPINSNGEIKAEEVGEVINQNKIVEVEDVYITIDYADVNQTTAWIENKYLPEKVPAIMADNTLQQLVVVWDTEKVTAKNGIRTYKGTLVGYNKTIDLYMTIPSEMLNDTNRITVYKNGSRNDMVIVDGNLTPVLNKEKTRIRIGEGDILKVYSDYEKTKLLGSAVAGKDGRAVITKLDLDQYGKSFYITITRVKKAESNPTEIRQYIPPSMNPMDVGNREEDKIGDKDSKGLGLDIRDITVGSWKIAELNVYEGNYLDKYFALKSQLGQDIYIVPYKTPLDMVKHASVKTLDLRERSWNGAALSKAEAFGKNKDSAGTAFRAGKYDLYVSNSYTGIGSPDIEKNYPIVEGKIANSILITYDMVEEVLPSKPVINAQRVQGREGNDGTANTKTNAFVTLSKPVPKNEVAWLVPKELLNTVKGWRAEDRPWPYKSQDDIEDNDLVRFNGEGVIMPSPKGDTGPTFYDKEYYLFMVNDVGASMEADKPIIVDNSKPTAILTQSLKTYDVGAPIFVASNEKGKVYVIQNTDSTHRLTPQMLEDAVKNRNALVASHSGNSLPVTITKSETLLDFIIGGVSNDPPYLVVSVDEAGNVSDVFEHQKIVISRNLEDLRGAIGEAETYVKEHPYDPIINQVTGLISKANTILYKPTVTQAEVNLMTKQLNDLVGRKNFVLTVTSGDNINVTVGANEITTNQMTVAQLLSKIAVTPGAVKKIVNASGGDVDGSELITNDMIVKAYLPNTEQEANYEIFVRSAFNISTQKELLHAININTSVSDISLAVGTIELEESITINRPITITGSSSMNSTIRLAGNKIMGDGSIVDAQIVNNSNLIIKRVNFIGTTGGRSTEVIKNLKQLELESCKFSGFEFIESGKSIIKSEDGAILKMTNCTLNASAPNLTFYHLDISNSSQLGTAVINTKFSGTEGVNVRGIYINGDSSSYNEIQIYKNTFTTFSSSNPRAMAIPIYIDGGIVTLTSNVVSSADIGVFVDIANKQSQINGFTFYKGIASEDMTANAKSGIYSKNPSVTKNFFGDIVIGQSIRGQVPIFNYNSMTTPTISQISITGNTLTVLDEKDSETNRFVFQRVSAKSTILPKKGTVLQNLSKYVPVSTPINDTSAGTGDFLIIVELDSADKIVKYRSITLP